jgi:hypothetical protein
MCRLLPFLSIPSRPLKLGTYKDRGDKENRGPSSYSTASGRTRAAAAHSLQSGGGGDTTDHSQSELLYSIADVEDEGMQAFFKLSSSNKTICCSKYGNKKPNLILLSPPDRLAAKLAKKDTLSSKLLQRPDRQELIDRNILHLVTDEERLVDRTVIGAKLIRRLSLRPTLEELEERNIMRSMLLFISLWHNFLKTNIAVSRKLFR